MDNHLRQLKRRFAQDPNDYETASALYKAYDKAGLYSERLRKHVDRLAFGRAERAAIHRADKESDELGHDPEEREQNRDYHITILHNPHLKHDPEFQRAEIRQDQAWQRARKRRGATPASPEYRERAAQERAMSREPVGGKRGRRYESVLHQPRTLLALGLLEADPGETPGEIVHGLSRRYKGRESYGNKPERFYSDYGDTEYDAPEGVKDERKRQGRETHVFDSPLDARRFHRSIRKEIPGVRTEVGRNPDPESFTPQQGYKPKVRVYPGDISPERARQRERTGPTTDERIARKEERRKSLGLPKTPVTSERRAWRREWSDVYTPRTLLVLEDIYGTNHVEHLLLDEGWRDTARNVALAGGMALAGLGLTPSSARAQGQPGATASQPPAATAKAQQGDSFGTTPLHKAMMNYHHGAFAKTVSNNTAADNPYMPKDSPQHIQSVRNTLRSTNPSTVSRANWQPHHHAAMQRAHEQYQRQIDGARGQKEKDQLTAEYGAKLHQHFNSINDAAKREAARKAAHSQGQQVGR